MGRWDSPQTGPDVSARVAGLLGAGPAIGLRDAPSSNFNPECCVFAIIEAAGWPIWVLLATSVVALALIIERSIALRGSRIVPAQVLERALGAYRERGAGAEALRSLAAGSPLGQVLAAGLRNHAASRPVMKEAIEEEGRIVAHELERFLNALGTIAAMAPLMGLFGTVVGMIEIFGSQSPGGANPQELAHGISVALYNTAFGLLIAIPSMIFYRYFRGKVEGFVVDMEQQAARLVDVLHGERGDAAPRR
jgi:biopolymer transport protein ExbB